MDIVLLSLLMRPLICFFFFKKIALFRICMFYKILITPILIQGTIYCIAT